MFIGSFELICAPDSQLPWHDQQRGHTCAIPEEGHKSHGETSQLELTHRKKEHNSSNGSQFNLGLLGFSLRYHSTACNSIAI